MDSVSTNALGEPAPCHLWAGGIALDEAKIAREMQYHRAATPEQSRADAARALVVRALLRLEAQRLGLADHITAASLAADAGDWLPSLFEQELEHQMPSEADCLRYFEQNKDRFRSPGRIRVRHILLAAAPDDVAERLGARQRGETLIAQLHAQAGLFADFAHRHSACPSRTNGGDLGWLQRGQTTPEFDRQIFRLREGLAGFPVESRWGYHVVSVDAIDAGTSLDFQAVHERISDYLELQRRQRDLHQYLQQLQQRHGVIGLTEIEAPAKQA